MKERLGEYGSDAEAFVASLRTIQRFEKRRVKLVEYLETVGVHDPRESLSRAVVVQRTQQACREAIAAKILTLADVEELVRYVAEVVELGGENTHDAGEGAGNGS